MDEHAQSELQRSRDRILRILLRSEEPLSVQALAARLGISRNAAHQQVAALERDGMIERDSSIRTKGRPSQGYRLSSAGNATFPRQYALIARQLLEELSRHLGPAELGLAMQRIGESLASSLPQEGGAIESVAGIMRELGYESSTVEGPGGAEIEARNCVFHDLAMADPNICEVDLAFLRSMTGRSVEHKRCMARGERSCRFAFGPPKPTA
jgi:predicted ArsR family transcriptional regulator